MIRTLAEAMGAIFKGSLLLFHTHATKISLGFGAMSSSFKVKGEYRSLAEMDTVQGD